VEIGPPVYTPEEEEFAKALQRGCGVPQSGMDRTIQPFSQGASWLCDTSEYSWLAPMANAWLACVPPGVGWHNWQVAACSNSSVGFKGMIYAIKVLMTTAVDLLLDHTLIPAAREEWMRHRGGRSFGGLLPQDAPVPLDINRKTMEEYRSLMGKERP
jgi:aminobenzoyl-glutamate utilization protein B